MKFEELSSDVQARIIDEEVQFLWETEWYETTLDEIQEIGEMVGIYVEKGFSFDLDRSNFGFSGEIAYKKGWKQDAIKKFGADVFSEKRTDAIANFLQSWDYFCQTTQKSHFYGLKADIRLGVYGDARINNVYWDRPEDNLSVSWSVEHEFDEFLTDFTDMSLKLLENEIEYLTSEERFIEQGLEYDEDGNEIIDMVA